MSLTVTDIARICHEVNRGYCTSLQDGSQVAWEDTAQEIKDSAIIGVKAVLANPKATPEDSHNSWMRFKLDSGWKYGAKKSESKKEHPSLRPYSELSQSEKSKDFIFRSTVLSLSKHLLEEEA